MPALHVISSSETKPSALSVSLTFHFQYTLFFPSELCVLLQSISFLLIAYHKKSVYEFTSITTKLLAQIWPNMHQEECYEGS